MASAFNAQSNPGVVFKFFSAVKSRNFMTAYGCLRQVSFGLLDMAYYTQKKDLMKSYIIFWCKDTSIWGKNKIKRKVFALSPPNYLL